MTQDGDVPTGAEGLDREPIEIGADDRDEVTASGVADQALSVGKSLLDKIKTWSAVLALLGALGQSVYASWFKPNAADSYDVTKAGIETLSGEVSTLGTATEKMFGAQREFESKIRDKHNAMDKNMSIEMALLKQRLKQLEEEVQRRHRYQAPTKISVSAPVLVGQIKSDDDQSREIQQLLSHDDVGPQPYGIQKKGRGLKLPERKAVFK